MVLILVLLAVIDVLLIVACLYEWVPMGRHARKMLAFVLLGVFPLVWGASAFTYNFNRIKNVEFCATCHAMDEHVGSLQLADETQALAPLHYQNNFVPQETACYFCHTNYTWFGPIKGKIGGIRHVYVNYFKGAPDPLELKIYEPYENRDCLRCHGKSKRWLNQKTHDRTPGMRDRMFSGELRCLNAGCHDQAHLLASEIAAAEEEDW